jgi:hypothetical protein
MAKLLGGLFYLTVRIAEISQFIAAVGVAILRQLLVVPDTSGDLKAKVLHGPFAARVKNNRRRG